MINLSFINFIMTIFFVELIISLLIIFCGTQLLVNSSIVLSNRLKIPKIIIGITIVSLATSLPELFVSLQSALKGFSEFAIGNIIGSNISNISIVMGIMGLASPIYLSKIELKLNYYPLIIITVLFVIALFSISVFSTTYGIVSLCLLSAFSMLLFKKGEKLISNEEYSQNNSVDFFGYKILVKKIIYLIFLLLIGSYILWLGSNVLIHSARGIASLIGVSDRVISISLVALGTSLPELFASLYSVVKGQSKMAVGNLLGSNIFNILAVLGITTLITNVEINPSLIYDSLIMLGFTILLLPMFYLNFNQIQLSINRGKGVLLICAYVIYLVFFLFN